MPELMFSYFRTRGVYAQYDTFVDTIAQGFRTDIAPDIVKLHENTTSGWKVQPEFIPTVHTDEDGVSVDVSVEGDGAKVWWWLNYGVEGREIVPSRARRMRRIKARYRKSPETYKRDPYKVGRLQPPWALKFTGEGGEDVFRVSVRWKGIRARRYTEKIAEEYRDTFYYKIELIKKRAVRACRSQEM